MRVLHVVHGFPPFGCGGAELYAESVARRLSDEWGDAVTVLTREHVEEAPEFRVRQERRDGLDVYWINNTFRTTRRFDETFDNPAITEAAARVIDAVRPDVAHIHHLTCLSTTIVDELARRDIPVVLTLHDYWMLCHRGQLLDRALVRCDGPGADGCAGCIGLDAGASATYAGAHALRWMASGLPAALATRMRSAARRVGGALASEHAARQASLARLRHMQARFAQLDVALAPSAHVRDRFVRAGFDSAPIVVSEYGVTSDPLPPPAQIRTGALRLGFAGALIVSKAPHLLVEAASRLPAGSVAIAIYGAPAPYHGDDTYTRDLDRRLSHPSVTRCEPVAHADIPHVMAALDALVFPSVWEETSGIGAREALAAGVPVIASRIGGIPETVVDGVNGLLFEPGDAGDLARQLQRLIEEPGLLARLRAGCRIPRTLGDDVRATRAMYAELLDAAEATRAKTRSAVRTPRVAAVILNYGTAEQTAMATEMLRRSQTRVAPVVVVDNGDGADCARALHSMSDDVVLHATGANLGFSGGCNVGIRESLALGADAVLLVNSDAIVPPDCLTRLLEAMARQPAPGIVAPVVRSRVSPARVLSAGIDYDTRTGRMRHRLAPPGQGGPDAVSGCVMLVHRTVFDRIGLLPEAYFFSFEDIAFCQDARAAGFSIDIEPRASAYHEGSGTMGSDPRRLYYAARNHLRLGASTPATSMWHMLGRQCAIASYNLAHAVTADGGTPPGRIAAVIRGVFDHLRGRTGER